MFAYLPAGVDFPFNEERVIPDGVNRNSAIIGGKSPYLDSSHKQAAVPTGYYFT